MSSSNKNGRAAGPISAADSSAASRATYPVMAGQKTELNEHNLHAQQEYYSPTYNNAHNASLDWAVYVSKLEADLQRATHAFPEHYDVHAMERHKRRLGRMHQYYYNDLPLRPPTAAAATPMERFSMLDPYNSPASFHERIAMRNDMGLDISGGGAPEKNARVIARAAGQVAQMSRLQHAAANGDEDVDDDNDDYANDDDNDVRSMMAGEPSQKSRSVVEKHQRRYRTEGPSERQVEVVRSSHRRRHPTGQSRK